MYKLVVTIYNVKPAKVLLIKCVSYSLENTIKVVAQMLELYVLTCCTALGDALQVFSNVRISSRDQFL